MAETKMSQEMAEKEFERWAENMDLDFDVRDDDDTNKLLLDTGKRAVVRGLMKGTLVVNDGGDLEYTVSRHSPQEFAGERVVMKMPSAHAFSVQGKNQNNMDIVVGIVTAMTGKDKGWLLRLSLNDYKVFQAVAGLFLLG